MYLDVILLVLFIIVYIYDIFIMWCVMWPQSCVSSSSQKEKKRKEYNSFKKNQKNQHSSKTKLKTWINTWNICSHLSKWCYFIHHLTINLYDPNHNEMSSTGMKLASNSWKESTMLIQQEEDSLLKCIWVVLLTNHISLH